mmetsp:Transcript_19816/g.78952  ORF Transcript_19816/g.78952 Transcript_19816/m.78952 type:complete len:374 (-) Transcript_19816:51-1172(-)
MGPPSDDHEMPGRRRPDADDESSIDDCTRPRESRAATIRRRLMFRTEKPLVVVILTVGLGARRTTDSGGGQRAGCPADAAVVRSRSGCRRPAVAEDAARPAPAVDVGRRIRGARVDAAAGRATAAAAAEEGVVVQVQHEPDHDRPRAARPRRRRRRRALRGVRGMLRLRARPVSAPAVMTKGLVTFVLDVAGEVLVVFRLDDGLVVVVQRLEPVLELRARARLAQQLPLEQGDLAARSAQLLAYLRVRARRASEVAQPTEQHGPGASENEREKAAQPREDDPRHDRQRSAPRRALESGAPREDGARSLDDVRVRVIIIIIFRFDRNEGRCRPDALPGGGETPLVVGCALGRRRAPAAGLLRRLSGPPPRLLHP